MIEDVEIAIVGNTRICMIRTFPLSSLGTRGIVLQTETRHTGEHQTYVAVPF